MTCCDKPQQKDLTQGLGPDRHIYCQSCKAHQYDGKFYTRQEWEIYVNQENEMIIFKTASEKRPRNYVGYRDGIRIVELSKKMKNGNFLGSIIMNH